MNTNQFFKADEVILSIAQMTGDDGFKWRSQGFYLGQLKDGLRKLAHDTRFDVKTIQEEVPSDLRWELPSDFHNVRQLWLYKGQNCTVENRVNTYRKWNYLTKGDGFLANNDGPNIDDPYFAPTGVELVSGLYYWSVQNGFLMFSDNSRSYRFHLQYNGLGISDPRQPSIPEFLREPLRHYLGHMVCQHRYREDPKLWGPMMRNFSDQMRESWRDARAEAATMDDKERDDLYEALSRMGPN